MSKFIAAAKGFVKGEEGATMVEYGLMVALIAVVCIGAVTTPRQRRSGILQQAITAVLGNPSPPAN